MAFEKLKTNLVSEPILANPYFAKPFYVQTEVNDEGNEQVVA